MQVRNYLFHRVSDERDPLWPPIKPTLFERIVKVLTKKYEIISLEEFLANGHSQRPKKPFATILFDDGYKDNIEYAAPILKKYNCKASFYIVTDCINRNLPTWTYLVDHALSQTKTLRLFFNGEYIPEPFKAVNLSSDSEKTKLKPWMKTLSNKRRVDILNSILDQCTDVTSPQNKMMSWKDISELHQAGHQIGSHSHTHPMLATLDNENEISSELQTSASIIKEKLGAAPRMISYPIGSYDERVIRLSIKAGYDWGLAVGQRFYEHGIDNLMAIPRMELYQQSWWKVSLRINGTNQLANRLWR